MFFLLCVVFFFQAEDGIRYLVRSRGLGDVYKRQVRKDLQRCECRPSFAKRSIEPAKLFSLRLLSLADLSLIHI